MNKDIRKFSLSCFAALAILLPAFNIYADGVRSVNVERKMVLKDVIASKYDIVRTDKWHGYSRIVFKFQGHEAWIVEPSCTPRADRAWTWTMQWADAFVERTGVLDLLGRGWHHVTIDTFRHRMNEEGLRVSREYQKFLVDELGFKSKANLVGMSWGGFFSTRYASRYPDCVSKIYLDAPLLVLDRLRGLPEADTVEKAERIIGPWARTGLKSGEWKNNSEMPVNLAERLAKTGIPILLLYGGEDQTVPPELNSEVFIEKFKSAGGKINVKRRYLFGHHPHGEELNNLGVITRFFEND